MCVSPRESTPLCGGRHSVFPFWFFFIYVPFVSPYDATLHYWFSALETLSHLEFLKQISAQVPPPEIVIKWGRGWGHGGRG